MFDFGRQNIIYLSSYVIIKNVCVHVMLLDVTSQ